MGRGSFVARAAAERPAFNPSLNWDSVLQPLNNSLASRHAEISFANSRPSEDAFPLAVFRRLTKDVIDSPEAAQILQLGSSHGYPPLRRYLIEQAVNGRVARGGDDVMITNGCQQALDLLARVFIQEAPVENRQVVVEDPVYHGLIRVFARAGANILPMPVSKSGIDWAGLAETVQQYRPRMLVVTPSFQNPTGATLPLEARKRIVEIAQRFSVVLVENDIYSELRYAGHPLPTLKELDDSGNTILLRSYSKVSFPGLRVGWVIAPRPVIARLADVKQISDLHSDQLSQAVLLRFAESGELALHLDRTRAAGAEKLKAVVRACARFMPKGTTITRPEGGMSLWMELPAPLTADALLNQVESRGVNFLPGRHFSAKRMHARGLRLSFGGLSPELIMRGIEILGQAAAAELAAYAAEPLLGPVAALV